MVEELLAFCRQRGLTEEDLDELVHEAVSKSAVPKVNEKTRGPQQEAILDNTEQKASRINNEGLKAQIDFLIGQYGAGDTKKLLETAAHQS